MSFLECFAISEYPKYFLDKQHLLLVCGTVLASLNITTKKLSVSCFKCLDMTDFPQICKLKRFKVVTPT